MTAIAAISQRLAAAPGGHAPFRLPYGVLVAGFALAGAGACFDLYLPLVNIPIQGAHEFWLAIWTAALVWADREGSLRRRLAPTLAVAALSAAVAGALHHLAGRSTLDQILDWAFEHTGTFGWLAGLWLAWPLLLDRAGARGSRPFRWACWALTIYATWCLISAITSLEPRKSLRYFTDERGLMFPVLCGWIRAAGADPRLRRHGAALMLGLMAALMATGTLIWVADTIGPEGLRERLVRGEAVFVEPAADSTLPPRRLQFPMRHFNRTSYLAMIALLAFWVAAVSGPWNRRRLAYWAAPIAAATAVLLASSTRSAIVAAVGGFAGWFLLVRRRALVGLAVMLGVGLALLPARSRDHLLTTFQPSTYLPGERRTSMQARIEAWRYGAELIGQWPLTGVGYGYKISRAVYEQHVRTTSDPDVFASFDDGYEMQHFHNLWLETAAESGLPAAAALLAFCMARWWMLARWFTRVRGVLGERRRAAAWAALEAAIQIAGLALYMLKLNFGMLTFFVWVQVLIEAESRASEVKPDRSATAAAS